MRVIGVLEFLKEPKGLSEIIRVDNGPEFMSLIIKDMTSIPITRG
jgi:hypothetical protein